MVLKIRQYRELKKRPLRAFKARLGLDQWSN